MKILLTAFDPFGGESDNISEQVLNALPERLDEMVLCKLILPTVFGLAAERAIEAAEALRPDAVVCLGQAAGRQAVTPERRAVNRMDASRPDNAGQQPQNRPIEPEGPAFVPATLPVDAMVEAIRAAGVAAEPSDSAGSFVCNSLLYAMLRWSGQRHPAVPCGFIHLPRGDRETLARGVAAALRALALRI